MFLRNILCTGMIGVIPGIHSFFGGPGGRFDIFCLRVREGVSLTFSRLFSKKITGWYTGEREARNARVPRHDHTTRQTQTPTDPRHSQPEGGTCY